MPTYLTVDDVVTLLKSARGERTLEDFCRDVDVSYQFLSHVERGVRQPGKKMLKYLGLVRITLYRQEPRYLVKSSKLKKEK